MSIISIEDIKAHANITIATDDTLLASKIEAAEAWIDRWLPTPMAEMSEVPADLKEAIRQLVAHLYENREATLIGISGEEVPFGVWNILDQHREWAF